MADLIKSLNTSGVETPNIAAIGDHLILVSKNQRRGFERRWYDNNFFDDGYHFRFLSRQTNKIVDLSEKQTVYSPTRVIPKASRQIRGIANMLTTDEPTPTIYPENISQSDYTDPNEYAQAVQTAKLYALRTGHWLTEEWKKQELMDKLSLMTILTLKHGVSYLQVYPDAIEERIKTQVFDAFDIYLMGNLTSIYDSPYIIKATPVLISQIKANEDFDDIQKEKINPDNKYASSEIKDAYLMARYGRETSSDEGATLILKEIFLKEYINDQNRSRIQSQEDGDKILKRKDGDPVIRQVFTAGGVWLRDKYLDLPDYPFVDFRMEPGNIYQVPQIERFISLNKSLDMVVSRVERYTHTMAAGIWLKRRGEQFKINNQSGGQVVEYDATPPTQGQIAPLPQFLFEFMGNLTSFIEEQGVSPLMLGHLPPGVKSAMAIEALKEAEITNLKTATRQFNRTIKNIAEKMLDLADSHFLTPQTVLYLSKGQPDYFDIIGGSALKTRKDKKISTPANAVPIKKDYRVEIEIEAGLGFTKTGQKQTIQNLAQFMLQMVQVGAASPDVMKYIVEKMLEIYQYGPNQELMDALDTQGQTQKLTDAQMTQMQTALLQALNDAGEVGQPASERRVMEGKVATLEALHESGLAKAPEQPQEPTSAQKVSESISYKDAPEDVKRQMEAQAGLKPSEGLSPAATDQLSKHHEMIQPDPSALPDQQAVQDVLPKKLAKQEAKGGK